MAMAYTLSGISEIVLRRKLIIRLNYKKKKKKNLNDVFCLENSFCNINLDVL